MASPRGRPEAVLRPKAAGQAFERELIAPSESLVEFVDYYWLVRQGHCAARQVEV